VGSRRRRLRGTLLLVVGTLLTGLMLAVALTDGLHKLELDTVDARFGIRGPEAPPEDIMTVDIDDRTFDELGVQWPFPRRMHARVIDVLRRAGAHVIAYDVQFTEPTTLRQDNALIDAVGRARGRVVLATSEVNEFGEAAVFGGADVVRDVGARVGNALLPNDDDGINRRIPYSLDGLESFAVAAVEVADRRPVSPELFEDGTAWIDYHGPPGVVRSVSFSEVYRGEVSPERLRDTIVVIGLTAPSLQDIHPTSASGEEPMSGVEVQANAISTVRRALPLRDTPEWLDAVLVVLLGLLVPVASLRLARRFGGPAAVLVVVVLAAATALLYAGAAQLAFGAGLILPVIYPLGAVALCTIGVLAIETAAAAFERERTRELFSRYVPESVVDEVLDSTDDDLCLAGTRLQSTIVFCDLRAFTGFAELRPAEQVIAVLNRYLSEMSEAIRIREGTLVAFQGDGIMAAFGAPVEQFDHADRALDAVRDMAGPRLSALNAWIRDQKLGDGFRMGVGVNSGVVMSGNIGCEWRLEYAAIGDTVNTASRLEAMTKDSPHQVLISETTRAMLRRDASDLRYVDAVTVRGKQVKANLWTLELPAPTAETAGPQVVRLSAAAPRQRAWPRAGGRAR